MALVEYLDRGALSNPDGACLTAANGETLTYRDVQRLSYRIGNKLISLGFSKGDLGSVVALNDPFAFACVFGLARAGMAWLPAHPRNSPDDHRYLFEFLECKLILFSSDFAELVEALRPQLPGVKAWVCLDRALDGIPSLETWLEGAADTDPDLPRCAEDLAIVLPTGGTTGRSKGVMWKSRVVDNMVATQMICMCYDQSERPVNMAAAPLTHAAGMITFATLSRGGEIVVLPKPDIAAMLDVIERYHVTELFLPPTVIYRMLEFPGVEGRDYRSLRYFVYAAAPMSVEKLKRAIKVFGPCMTQSYGQSEAPMLVTFFSPQQHAPNGKLAPDSRLAACGFPTPLVEVRILDDDNHELPHGTPGELCVRGDLVMDGYFKQPDKTAATIIDGWLHTGDVAVQDADGWLRVVDRKKDMIISGGLNVYPQEIEQIIWTHPAVEDCSVIGIPDDDWGERVTAVVELAPGGKASAGEIQALCKKHLGSLKTPKAVYFRKLPRSPNGKVLKRALRDEYWKDAERQV